MAIPTSPTAFITNAFLAASTAERRSCQKPDQSPPDQKQGEVSGHHEEEHGEEEEIHVDEEAPLLRVAVHVADRVHDDERADPGDDQQLDARERVDQEVQRHLEALARRPLVERVDVVALLRRVGGEGDEDVHGGEEGRPGGGRAEPGGGGAGQPVAGDRQDGDAGERGEQADPARELHASSEAR
jgi:hypothetical protein